MNGPSIKWSEDKVPQSNNVDLWSKLGIHGIPIVLPRGGGDEIYSVIMANLIGHSQTLKAGTVLGKLYSASRSIPVEVEHIKTLLEEVMELMTNHLSSVNAPIYPPSVFTGPIYKPGVVGLKQALSYYSHERRSKVVGVNTTVSSIHGPREMEFDINNLELEATQEGGSEDDSNQALQSFCYLIKSVGTAQDQTL
ncbi:hypothetical protein HMPREF1544_09191 [Mucor circinelloides 1006PhL]|uniref:Uncharacterized protein n=1 Tax=Mucor circinelloides f. circinelloides (strain 1006PhL) TaxID=1220926 RepID=S2JW39_MUCC1|nr:hypothetical protein HMPREF1544_09191 [Mucor circinelloides 1006PhL]